MVLPRGCMTPVHAAQSLVGCARSHLRRERPGGDANRGKNKVFPVRKSGCALLFCVLSKSKSKRQTAAGKSR